jgi:hypothetical protein
MLLSYAGEEMLTTDRLGEAVVDYARALVAERAADVVDVPIIRGTGAAVARLLIGPMAQLVALPASGANVELNDASALAAIRAKLNTVGHSHAAISRKSLWDEFALAYDFL